MDSLDHHMIDSELVDMWYETVPVSRFEFAAIDLAVTSVTSILADQSVASESKRTHDQCQDCSLT